MGSITSEATVAAVACRFGDEIRSVHSYAGWYFSRNGARRGMLWSKEVLEAVTGRKIGTVCYLSGLSGGVPEQSCLIPQACGFVCGLTMLYPFNRNKLPTPNMQCYDWNELPGASRPVFDCDRLEGRLYALEEPLGGL